MANHLDKITSFVKRELEFVPAAVRFDLKIASVDGMEERCDSFRVEEGAPLKETVEAIVAGIDSTAKSFAEEANVRVKFKIYSWYRKPARLEGGKSTIAPLHAEIFSLPGKLIGPVQGHGSDIGVHESEPATSTGLLGQLMRHIENVTTDKRLLEAHIFDHVLQENRRLSAEVQRFYKLDAEVRSEREAIISEAHSRDMEKSKFENDEERKRQAFEMLVKVVGPRFAEYLPNIMESMLGKKPELPADASSDEKMKKLQLTFLAIKEETRNEVIQKIMESDPKVASQLFELLGLT